ncbi:hypothetical protein [Streptomyces sp. MB09-02B]|nr:hypothetical protein [Streptomyces sp. MB09-02B]MDX3638528.1 hypothetical protein [Streptomyces sp. MB09-02B]
MSSAVRSSPRITALEDVLDVRVPTCFVDPVRVTGGPVWAARV